jgi:DNA repair protein RadC
MKRTAILSSQNAYQLFKKQMSKDIEEFWALALNSRKELISCRMLFRGTVDCCMVHPRDVFRFGITENASTLLLGHNHPSGDCYPSMEDVQITENLYRLSLLLQIPILDHIVITQKDYYSFKDSKRLFINGPDWSVGHTLMGRRTSSASRR